MHIADLSNSYYSQCRKAVFNRLLCKLLLYGSTTLLAFLVHVAGAWMAHIYGRSGFFSSAVSCPGISAYLSDQCRSILRSL